MVALEYPDGTWGCGGGCAFRGTLDDVHSHMDAVPHPTVHGTHPIGVWCSKCPTTIDDAKAQWADLVFLSQLASTGWVLQPHHAALIGGMTRPGFA